MAEALQGAERRLAVFHVYPPAGHRADPGRLQFLQAGPGVAGFEVLVVVAEQDQHGAHRRIVGGDPFDHLRRLVVAAVDHENDFADPVLDEIAGSDPAQGVGAVAGGNDKGDHP